MNDTKVIPLIAYDMYPQTLVVTHADHARTKAGAGGKE